MPEQPRLVPRMFVLGHRGMLGSMVLDVARDQGLECLTSEARYTGRPDDALVADVASSNPNVIVNCAGITTRRSGNADELMVANALLPQHLAAIFGSSSLIIHASTDCVFSGSRGWYSVVDTPDATDAYGVSKRLGELAGSIPGSQVVILRTSIVGPERHTTRGLLAWFLAQQGPVSGWTDHQWNGITTFAWANLALDIALGRRRLPPGVHHPCTAESISKDGLLRLFAEVFEHQIPITAARTGRAVNRTLVPTLVMPPQAEQLREMRAFWVRARS